MIDGEDATGIIGQVGYMLQKDLLLPWRTVLDNVALGMEIRGVPKSEARERALPLLHRYGLGGFEHRYPSALSGGMRQRAALLRTLLIDVDVILLDEPFGALDAQTKAHMQVSSITCLTAISSALPDNAFGRYWRMMSISSRSRIASSIRPSSSCSRAEASR
jgi:ABC-type nitrate/sulfonate/bicarbonate transport system ATPase subunit